MHGIIYLMISKGFDQFKAISEAITLQKYNVFFLMLD